MGVQGCSVRNLFPPLPPLNESVKSDKSNREQKLDDNDSLTESEASSYENKKKKVQLSVQSASSKSPSLERQ